MHTPTCGVSFWYAATTPELGQSRAEDLSSYSSLSRFLPLSSCCAVLLSLGVLGLNDRSGYTGIHLSGLRPLHCWFAPDMRSIARWPAFAPARRLRAPRAIRASYNSSAPAAPGPTRDSPVSGAVDLGGPVAGPSTTPDPHYNVGMKVCVQSRLQSI